MDKKLLTKKRNTDTAFVPLVGKAVSKGERITRGFFKHFYPNEKVFYNYRPDWLRNPKTGLNLELDIYYPNLKLAIEFQGLHHKLEEQIEKDNLKKKVCEERGIELFCLYGPLSLFHYKIKKNLPTIPKSLKIKIKRYQKSRKGKTGKYVKMVKWKLKQKEYKNLQKQEIADNLKRRKNKLL